MRKFFTFMITGSIVLFFITLISCENDETMVTITDSIVNDSTAKVSALATTTPVYYVTPTVGNYTPNSSNSIILPGISGCGSFSGGILRAKIHSQSGSSFTIQISKQDGSNFSVGGTAYIKANSVCGNTDISQTYTAGTNIISLTITTTFTQGLSHFYPVVVSSSGGTRYYAEPFMVYTLPSYASGPYSDGMILATVDDIALKSSGPNNIDNPTDGTSTWQCTDFCKRYYNTVYSLSFSGWGNAKEWYYNYDYTRFDRYVNNGTIAPRIGDIVCFDNNPSSSTKYGHVAIITEVSATQVKIAQQNSGTTWLPIGGNINRSVNNLTLSGYTVQGWLRKKQ